MPVIVVGKLKGQDVRPQQNGKQWVRGMVALHVACKPLLKQLKQSRLDFTITTGMVLPTELVILMGEYDTYEFPNDPGKTWHTLNIQKIITQQSPLWKSIGMSFERAIPLIAKKDPACLEKLGTEPLLLRARICDLVGTKNSFADKLIELYGDHAYDELCENPWKMIHVVPYYTVTHADKVAAKVGLSLDDPLRFQEVFRYHLDASFESHRNTYTSESEFLALYWMHFSDAMTLEEYKALATTEGAPVRRTRLGYHPTHFYQAERISHRLLTDAIRVELPASEDEQMLVKEVQEQSPVPLASAQCDAVERSFCSPLHVIKGGPGTGKTTSLNTVLEKLVRRTGYQRNEADAPFLLAAPSGKAAFRMWEQTGVAAHTIHSAFGIIPGYGCINATETAKRLSHIRYIIIDEASMLDTQLFGDICQVMYAMDHIPFLLLVGDPDQLPPVQHGQVFVDIINFLEAHAPTHVTELTELKRQQQDSHILDISGYIRKGQFPDLDWFADKDDVFFVPTTMETLSQTLTQLVLKPKQDRIHDIQILTPYRNGDAPDTVHNLNQMVKPLYNPQSQDATTPSITVGTVPRTFHEGDTVINRKNISETIVNGSIGQVVKLNTTSRDIFAWTATIQFDAETHTFLYEELQDLELAYAITVHASQGSEYENVVVCITRGFANPDFLTRNLLYVAATRPSKRLLFLGDIATFKNMAATLQKPRLTALQYWLHVCPM